MQNHNNIFLIFITILCIVFSHCASTNAPMGWLVKPESVPTDTYGAWIKIRTHHGLISGELISLMNDTVFVADTAALHGVASADIISARLATYNAAHSNIGAFAFFGTISTISNGAFLIFTAPMWIIGGTIASIIRSYEPIIDYPKRPLTDFSPYARYPQGLPSGLQRNDIRMKQNRSSER